ncbi:MAG: hypothetical protein V7603_2110 [Micromonosporaceae bacterium]
MKYLMLLYDIPNVREIISPAAMAEMGALLNGLTESGELLSTEGLADPSQTRTIRERDGVTVVTDGPFAEAKEHMGGFLLLDVEDEGRAVEIAASWPAGLCAAIEVRPLMNQGGADV